MDVKSKDSITIEDFYFEETKLDVGQLSSCENIKLYEVLFEALKIKVDDLSRKNFKLRNRNRPLEIKVKTFELSLIPLIALEPSNFVVPSDESALCKQLKIIRVCHKSLSL